MYGIDRYAWGNAITTVDPGQKAAVAGVALLLCLALNTIPVSLLTIGWMLGLALVWARLPVRAILVVVLGELLFLTLSTLGLIVSIGTPPTDGVLLAWPVGNGGVYISQASLLLATALILRALGCAVAMSLLALTTPLVDLIALLQRWRVPDLLIDLMTISLRSIFVLLTVIERTYVAQDSRLGYCNSARSLISAANLGSRIFLETLRRTRQLGIALESRGYGGGVLPLMPLPYRRPWYGWLFAVAVAMTLLWMRWEY